MEIRRLEEKDLFEVQSEKLPGQYYVVDLQAKSCTCNHFKFRGVRCKHIHRALENYPEKHESLIYTDDPPEKDFHYELIY